MKWWQIMIMVIGGAMVGALLAYGCTLWYIGRNMWS
jgi:membrane-associated phospholipid phosphatase